MNRVVSNIVLGFFVLVLITAYGIAKQASPYDSLFDGSRQLTAGDQVPIPNRVTAARDLGLPDGSELYVWVADNDEDRKAGLAGWPKLGEREGMLFVFEEPGIYGMWMKGMLIDLDIIWLNAAGVVVYVAEGVQAPRPGEANLPIYSNPRPAQYVIEVAAGQARQLNLGVGTQVEIPETNRPADR